MFPKTSVGTLLEQSKQILSESLLHIVADCPIQRTLWFFRPSHNSIGQKGNLRFPIDCAYLTPLLITRWQPPPDITQLRVAKDSGGVCDTCVIGQYTDATKQLTCQICSEGTTTAAAATASNDCTTCLAGRFRASTSSGLLHIVADCPIQRTLWFFRPSHNSIGQKGNLRFPIDCAYLTPLLITRWQPPPDITQLRVAKDLLWDFSF